MPDDPAAGLLARFEALLNRIPKASEDDEDGHEKPVPYSRFKAERLRAKAAEEAAAAMRAEVDGLKKSYQDELKAIQTAAAADVGRMAQRAAEDLALDKLNLDEDGRAELRRVYDRMPPEGRPKTAVDLWRGVLDGVKAHRADPKAAAPEVPRTLAGYLPAPEAEQPAKPEPKPGMQPRRGVSPDRTVVTGPRTTAAERISKAKTWDELHAATAEADAGG